MASTLVIYATTDGHTRRICERLAAQLTSATDSVTLTPIEGARAEQLPRFDRIVIGGSIRYGRHGAPLRAFVAANARVLSERRSAFFSVNLTARKPGKDRADTNPYVRRFLAQTRWDARIADVFAGKLDYPRYGWLDRQVIRFIMLITGGPTDPRAVVEYTDWQRVAAFARQVAVM